jgi:hypothetical protein
MKKLLFYTLGLSSLVMVSCQKEISMETGGNPGNGGGNGGNPLGLLVKLVAKSGGDSTVLNFGYNSDKKLTSLVTSGVASGTAIDLRERFVRNSQGIVTQTITKTADLAQFGLDSLITNVTYNTSTSRYVSRVTVIDVMGIVIRDSVALGYDASGKVNVEEDFMDYGTAGGYVRSSKNEYTYSGNNITVVKSSAYDDASSSYTEQFTDNFTYDTKTSPLILGNEAFAVGYANWFSSNNIIKSVIVDPTDPTANETVDVTIVYNSSNKPVTSTEVVQGGGTTINTFTYN